MNVKSLMTKDVELIEETEPLVNVARMMRDDDIGSVPVRNGDRLVGMVTDRDIVTRALADGKKAGELCAKDAMTDRVLYCREDWSAEEAAANMAKNRVRRLPVLDENKRLVGIISLGDISQTVDFSATGAAYGEIAAAPGR